MAFKRLINLYDSTSLASLNSQLKELFESIENNDMNKVYQLSLAISKELVEVKKSLDEIKKEINEESENIQTIKDIQSVLIVELSNTTEELETLNTYLKTIEENSTALIESIELNVTEIKDEINNIVSIARDDFITEIQEIIENFNKELKIKLLNMVTRQELTNNTFHLNVNSLRINDENIQDYLTNSSKYYDEIYEIKTNEEYITPQKFFNYSEFVLNNDNAKAYYRDGDSTYEKTLSEIFENAVKVEVLNNLGTYSLIEHSLNDEMHTVYSMKDYIEKKAVLSFKYSLYYSDDIISNMTVKFPNLVKTEEELWGEYSDFLLRGNLFGGYVNFHSKAGYYEDFTITYKVMHENIDYVRPARWGKTGFSIKVTYEKED